MSEPTEPPARGWVARTLAGAVKRLDVHLRRAHGVFEYTASPDCIFRITVEPAREAAVLPDGARIERGDRIVDLHFWNEQLPAMPSAGPTFAWASLFRHQLEASLREIAARVETDPRLQGVKAVRGEIASPTRGQRDTIRRFAAHFGFLTVGPTSPPTPGRRFQDLLDDIWMLILVWTYNPVGLERRTFTLRREETWLSRPALMARFGPGAGRSARARSAAAQAEPGPTRGLTKTK